MKKPHKHLYVLYDQEGYVATLTTSIYSSKKKAKEGIKNDNRHLNSKIVHYVKVED